MFDKELDSGWAIVLVVIVIFCALAISDVAKHSNPSYWHFEHHAKTDSICTSSCTFKSEAE